MARAIAILLVAASAPALAERDDPTAELNGERDALIEQIAAGRDSAAVLKKFVALLDRREQVVAAAKAATEAQREARNPKEVSVDARIESTNCEFSFAPPPPGHRRHTRDAAVVRVVRRGELRLPPRNDLDPGELLKFIELDHDGELFHLRIDKEKDGALERARPGDTALMCGVDIVNRREYGEWGQNFAFVGWAALIKGAPSVMKYAAHNPVFVPTRELDHALRNIKWPYKGQTVFLRAHVADAAASTRYRVMSGNADFLLDVPRGTPGEKLVVPGKAPWVLAVGQFDPDTRKLLLRAIAIEERLVTERP
jgi:hypothetical protein